MAKKNTLLAYSFGVLFSFFISTNAHGACSGASPTWTAANASRTEVLACITAASSGDTIYVPAGSATWTSGIDLPSNKDLKLVGATKITCTGTEGTASYSCTAGTTNTTLTCPGGCFSLNFAASHEVTGFTMTNAASQEIISCGGNVNNSKHFSIHHNRLISTGGWNPTRCGRDNSTGNHPQGIWHHNRLEDVAIHTNGTLMMLSEGNYQNQIWAQETPLGNSSNVIYVEANHFVSSSTSSSPGNFTDGNYGGRVVIRFNKTEGGYATAFEFHSPQGANRGFQRWELYNNAVTNLDTNDKCFHGLFNLRGGSGVIFNNAMSGALAGCNFDGLVDNVRSTWATGSSVDGIRACDGGSPWDQNTSGQTGWHCRDQVGTARDYSLWSHTSTPAWNQELKPGYIFLNTRGGAALNAFIPSDGRNASHIKWNRELYQSAGASCSGSACSTGVGSGPIANRPVNCTPGTAYWATDEGEWNSLQPGPDGRLYKCTAANTWTLYYTPYSYPHPWRGDGSAAPPVSDPLASPTGLQVTVR